MSVPPILKIEVETPSSEGEGLGVGVKLARARAHGAAAAQARYRRERAELGVEELQVLEDCAASSLLGRGLGRRRRLGERRRLQLQHMREALAAAHEEAAADARVLEHGVAARDGLRPRSLHEEGL